MNNLTIITSFNRKESLLNLINKLEKQNTDIIIYDDCSNFQLDRPDYVKFSFNYGKEYLWLKFKRIFAELPKTYDNYILLPDDIDIDNNFIENAVNSWNELPDQNKICLSLLTDIRVNKPNWTNFAPIKKGNYIQTQWTDFCFICSKDFFNVEINPIPLHRWLILAKQLNMELGSGLGGQISRFWHSVGKTMWHTEKSLVKHGKCKSEMNPKERLKNPLN